MISADGTSFAPTAPFWTAIARESLTLPFCDECGRPRWYPLDACTACGSVELPVWRDLGGTATLYTWTRVHRAFDPRHDVPFVVGLLEPDGAPGARIAAQIVCDGDPVIGGRMVVRFRSLGDGLHPYFVPSTTP